MNHSITLMMSYIEYTIFISLFIITYIISEYIDIFHDKIRFGLSITILYKIYLIYIVHPCDFIYSTMCVNLLEFA